MIYLVHGNGFQTHDLQSMRPLDQGSWTYFFYLTRNIATQKYFKIYFFEKVKASIN